MNLKNLFQRKPVAANSERASAIGANTEPLPDGDGWFKVAPYGEFPLAAGNGQTLVQKFSREDADAMVAAFNSLVARAGRMFRGLPIYIGHPDVDRKAFPDERRLGKVLDLEAREDGLYGKPAWNSLGQENLAEGYWVYPSPAWYYRKPAPGQKVIVPDELKSIGLTNTPNILASEPVTMNAGAGTDPADRTDEFEQETNQQDNDMKLKPELMAALGLTEQSTPEEIQAAVEAALEAGMAKPEPEKVAELEMEAENAKKEKDAALAACNAAKAAHADDLVAIAVNTGKCTKAEAEALRPEFDTDFDAAKAKLDAMKGTAMNTEPLDIGGRKVAINDAAQRRAAIADEVQRRMDAQGVSYDVAWNSVARDKKFAPLFAAMQKPE